MTIREGDREAKVVLGGGCFVCVGDREEGSRSFNDLFLLVLWPSMVHPPMTRRKGVALVLLSSTYVLTTGYGFEQQH